MTHSLMDARNASNERSVGDSLESGEKALRGEPSRKGNEAAPDSEDLPGSLVEGLPKFDRATDKWGKRPVWTRREVEAHDELRAAFAAWTEGKGIFFDTDARLARAIADVLGFDLRFGTDDE